MKRFTLSGTDFFSKISGLKVSLENANGYRSDNYAVLQLEGAVIESYSLLSNEVCNYISPVGLLFDFSPDRFFV